jgi:hypothetical protein
LHIVSLFWLFMSVFSILPMFSGVITAKDMSELSSLSRYNVDSVTQGKLTDIMNLWKH